MPNQPTRALAEVLRGAGIDLRADGDYLVSSEGIRLRPTMDVDEVDGHAVLVQRRITGAVKERFESTEAGWLDDRRLRIRTQGLMVDIDTDALSGSRRSERAVRVLAGRAITRGDHGCVDVVARVDGRDPALAKRAEVSPGGISLAVKRLVDSGLMTDDRRATSALFWTAAREWRPHWDEVSLPPDSPAVEVGARVAASLGAPIVSGPDTTREFLVRTSVLAPLTSDTNSDRGAVRVAMAPSPIVLTDTPVAQVSLVALTLATDLGRGIEIVENWDGNHVWH
ncbi:MAG: hypothetical protein V9F03_07000 [Microthrixaceae bacterium]